MTPLIEALPSPGRVAVAKLQVRLRCVQRGPSKVKSAIDLTGYEQEQEALPMVHSLARLSCPGQLSRYQRLRAPDTCREPEDRPPLCRYTGGRRWTASYPM